MNQGSQTSYFQRHNRKGKLPHGGKWELTNEPPKHEISSENIPILESRTRRRGRRGGRGGATGSSLYTTFENPLRGNDAFYAFIMSSKQHRNDLPPPPEHYNDAKNHPLWQQWLEAMLNEIEECRKRGVFKVISKNNNLIPKPIPLRWVYDYKFDSEGFLIRLKARLCVRGDKQPLNELDTYAATLAAETMRFLLGIAAYFDLEMRQYDAVTAFLNMDLDEVIHTAVPPGFGGKEHVWLLQRALYGLRRSPHLWYNELAGFLQSLGLEPIPGVNCIYHNDWLVVFFFGDDIICLYRKEDEEQFNEFEQKLSSKYELRKMGEPQLFLGVEIQRDRSSRSITITQTAYIDKITKRFEKSLLPALRIIRFRGDVSRLSSIDASTGPKAARRAAKSTELHFVAHWEKPYTENRKMNVVNEKGGSQADYPRIPNDIKHILLWSLPTIPYPLGRCRRFILKSTKDVFARC
jgi:hypothetical protein